MSENKQFKLHIEWYNQEKTDGKATLKEIGQPLGVIESIEDARLIRNTLNELYDENEVLKERNQELYDKLQVTMSKHSLQMGETELIKHMIQKAYETERTAIGKNVLKQLLESMGE